MTKCIVISDIHINDWASEVPGARLNNYIKLSEIIRDKAKEINAPWVFMAGDIIDKPVLPPHIVSVLKKFLANILQANCQIGIILGQHDQNTREIEDLKDTYLGVFMNKNIHYLHRKSLLIDGNKLYFENFTRSMEVDPIEDSDVYISHVTMGRQKVNNKKFKLGLFGDIHDIMDIGNMHSICPPICNHAHEYPYGVIGILTLNNGSEPEFSRWIYDPTFKIFPKLEKKINEIKNDDKLTDEEKIIVSMLSNEHDFYKDIEDTVKSLGLEDIHHEIDITNAPEAISLDFKIKKIYARDFKSIKDMCFESDDLGKIVFVSGKNGSGKTSIMEAVYVALVGERRLVDRYQSLREGADIMVGIVLEYKGTTYEICRGNGWTKFMINGEEVQKGNKAKLEDYINQCLPFLSLVPFFYIKTYEHFFDKDRLTLVKKCFNLEIFDYFYEKGFMLSKIVQKQLSDLMTRTTQLKGNYQQEQLALENIKRDLKEYEEVDISREGKISEELNELRSTLVKRASLKMQSQTLRDRIEELKKILAEVPKGSKEEIQNKINEYSEMDKLSSEIKFCKQTIISKENLLKGVKTVVCPNCSTEFQYEGQAKDTLLADIENSKKELQEKQNKFSIYFNNLSGETKSSLQSKLNKLEKRELYELQVKSYEAELESVYAQMRDYDLDLSQMTQEKDLQEELVRIGKKKLLIDNMTRSKGNLDLILSDARELKVQRDEKAAKADKVLKYIQLFDMKNLDSLPYRILQKISKFLSNDEIEFKTCTELANGNLKLDISCKMKVGNTFIDYDRCSHGQKTYLDFYILSRFLELLGTVGFLGIDEGLSALNVESYDKVCDIIKELKANMIFITSHQAGFAAYNSLIECELNLEGITEWRVSA